MLSTEDKSQPVRHGVADLVALARGKLSDPILLDWALQRYQDAARHQPELREAMEEHWLDELSLRRWLDLEDEDLLIRLLAEVPNERFAPAAEALAERWEGWQGRLANHAAAILATHRPDLAAKRFAARLERDLSDDDLVLAIIGALERLPPEQARALAHRLVRRLREGRRIDVSGRGLALDELISGAFNLDRTLALDLAREQLARPESAQALQRTLSAVASKLLTQPVWAQHAGDLRAGETTAAFADLAPFFHPDAPLAELDRHCAGPARIDALAELATQWVAESDRDFIAALTAVLQKPGTPVAYQEHYAAFLVGAIASACARLELTTSSLDLTAAIDLLGVDLDVEAHPHQQALVGHLAMFDRPVVAQRLAETLQRERASYGAWHIAAAMGHLGWEELAPALVSAMAEDNPDFLCEAAQDALRRIGIEAQRYLISAWDGLDNSQRIYGLTVIEEIGGEAAAELALNREQALLQDEEDDELWYRLALAAPDERFLVRLEPQLRRQQSLIDETFYCLARLFDVEHPQLAAVGERIQARRAQQRARLAALRRGDWSQDALSLALRCPACGDVNRYEVRRLVVDPRAAGSSWLLGEEHACASCGQHTDLEATNEANLAVMGELLSLTATRDAGLAGRSRILVRAEVPLGGRPLPVAEVVAHCRDSLAEHPERVTDWLRLGLCYHQLLGRPRAALLSLERALRIEPMAIEGIVLRADALARLGRLSPALDLLDQALQHKERWRFFLADVKAPAQLGADFAHLYNTLLDRLGRRDRARLHGAFLATPKKVGRNDPCPCGSGKKYKKCCLASG